jgi:hypothetical protein
VSAIVIVIGKAELIQSSVVFLPIKDPFQTTPSQYSSSLNRTDCTIFDSPCLSWLAATR